MKDNTVTISEQRVEWVDVLKFLGIFAIYLGHFGSCAGKLYEFVFEYHVPLFFFMSGFFATKIHQETTAQFVKKKFCVLMLPYFLFAFLSEIVTALTQNLDAHQVVHDLIKYVLGVRNTLPAGQLWFFPCLFLVTVIYYLLLRVVKNKYIILALATAVFSFINVSPPSWFWNLDSAFSFLFYYALGAVVFPLLNALRFQKLGLKGKLVYVLMLVFSGAFTAGCYFKGSVYFLGGVSLPFYLCKLYFGIVACILIYFNIQLAFVFEHINLFGRIGKETLLLCGLELIVKPTLATALNLMGMKLTLVSPFATVLYTAVCIGIAFLLSKPMKKLFPFILCQSQRSAKKAC